MDFPNEAVGRRGDDRCRLFREKQSQRTALPPPTSVGNRDHVVGQDQGAMNGDVFLVDLMRCRPSADQAEMADEMAQVDALERV